MILLPIFMSLTAAITDVSSQKLLKSCQLKVDKLSTNRAIMDISDAELKAGLQKYLNHGNILNRFKFALLGAPTISEVRQKIVDAELMNRVTAFCEQNNRLSGISLTRKERKKI